MFQTSSSCIKLHAVVVLELLLSEHCSRCVYLDGSNVENKISLLVILCIIMYVLKKKKKKKKNRNLNRYSFLTKPIMVKCLNIGKNIGKPIYRSISSRNTDTLFSFKSKLKQT